MKPNLELRPQCLIAVLLCLVAHSAGAVIELYPNGTVDRTSDINNALVTAKNTGDYVRLNSGTYHHSGQITINGAELRGVGDASILHATNPADCCVRLTGTAPKLKTCLVRTNYGGSVIPSSPDRLPTDVSALVYVKDATNFLVDNVTIRTGRSGGIMVNNSGGSSSSSKAYIQNCRIRDTLADGIHLTNGCKYIVVQSNTVTNTADDMIAVVSYKFQRDGVTPKDPVACRDIGINSNNLSANVWGRGITANGGHHLSITNNTVTNSYHSGMIFIAEGNPYYAWPTSDITVFNNTLTGCNVSDNSGQNGITIKGRSGYNVSNLSISETDIVNAKRRGVFVGTFTSGITFTDCLVNGATGAGLEVQGANNVEFRGTTNTSYTSFIKNTGSYGVVTNTACTGYVRIRNTRFEQINKTSGNPAFDVINVGEGTGLTATITGNHYTNPAAATVHRYIECNETTYTTPINPANTKTVTISSSPSVFSP